MAVAVDESLLDVLQRHSGQHPNRVAYTFLDSAATAAVELTYASLDRRARAAGAALISLGAEGRAVLVLCPEGLDYVVALLGCLYAGAIAVPAYPPGKGGVARAWQRIRAIAQDSGAQSALTTGELRARWAADAERPLGEIALVDVSSAVQGDALGGVVVGAAPERPAILQYTSGSTSEPKGVLLTNAQLLAGQEIIRAGSTTTADDVFLSWLPPFHDMGLMGGIFQALYVGGRAVLMPSQAFVRRPKRWLVAAQHHRASVLMAPNFAFDLCLRRIDARDRVGLDLTSVRVVCNGAEPIKPSTIASFAHAFAAHGLRREAMYPCYGMAEATLMISGGDPASPPLVRAYDAGELEQGHAARVAGPSESAPRTRTLVGCGHALLDERILIVDPYTLCTLPEGRVGEIWVQSRSVALGYWNRPEETERTFRAHTADTHEGPFLRTGDLGFFDEGELFITGRLKDLIIVRGRNHYPQDIERTVQDMHAALVADAGAAFSVDGELGEQLVVVQELDKRLGADQDALLRGAAQAIREAHDLAPAALVLIKRGSMLKTSSGKVQRRATRQAYLAGDLQVVASWQLAGADRGRDQSSAPSAGSLPSPRWSERPQRSADAPPPRTVEQSQGGDDAPPFRTLTRPTALQREQRIVQWLRERLAEKLERDAGEIDPREPLARYGVDSLLAAELTEELQQWLGTQLPATISYDNPTIADLARALSGGDAATRPSAPAVRAPRQRARARAQEPIAIVGMACRFPGAPNLKGFWQLLRNGVDAISEVPPERWDADALYDPEPGARGKMCSKWGGFVEGVDAFDAAFFGISTHEAARLDPQQRMFLEVAWEALEDAGQAPTALAGSATGVFAGVCGSEYSLLYGGDLQMIDADYGTGNAPSIVANRLSYFLDLKGPSETVDSACSSSLVALQHACRSLRELDCELAIVGGVNVVLAPEASVYFSHARALSRDGRCKSFDSRADGFVRSEGAGVVVLKPLSAALADGDRVYALLAGGAVNHDGRSNGLLAPNGRSQQALLQQALRSAEVSADEIDYVECHGVGTPVADAVELRALGEVMAGRPPGRPLLVGSAKTNVGHLEAASGMVALIKVALALHHAEIPPHLHLRDVHPDIGIDALPLEIPTLAVPWRRGERPRFAGLSAFGFGGTNAHVVLREAPAARVHPCDHERPRHLLVLSARTPAALSQLAARTRHALAHAPPELFADYCFTAGVGRSHFAHRLGVSAADAADAREALQRFAGGAPAPGVHAGVLKPGARLRVAFAFPQRVVSPGAALALWQAHPRLRQSLEHCNRVLAQELEHPLLDALYHAPQSERAALLCRPSYGHAALLALHYALHALWRSWGLEPSAVYGSGAGEYAAAAAAGAMSWEQALVLATRRGVVLEGLAPGATQRLTVHGLRVALDAAQYAAPELPLASAWRGGWLAPGELPNTEHWARQLYHEPTAAGGVPALIGEHADICLELGPAAAADPGPAELALPSLCASGDDWAALLGTLAQLYARGAEIDWRAFDAPYPRAKLTLPSYPFQRERHWLDFPKRKLERAEPAVIERPSSHPLISRVRIHVPGRSGFARRAESGVAVHGEPAAEHDERIAEEGESAAE